MADEEPTYLDIDAGKVIGRVLDFIAEIRSKPLDPGKHHRITLCFGESGAAWSEVACNCDPERQTR
jgi:hypothetical protein